MSGSGPRFCDSGSFGDLFVNNRVHPAFAFAAQRRAVGESRRANQQAQIARERAEELDNALSSLGIAKAMGDRKQGIDQDDIEKSLMLPSEP